MGIPRRALAHRPSSHHSQGSVECLPKSRAPRRSPESGPSAHTETLLRHSSAGGGCGSAHHSAAPRASRSERNHDLSPSLTTAPQRNRKSAGLAQAERQGTAEKVDEPPATRDGPSVPSCSPPIPPTHPQLHHLAQP